MNRHNKGQGSRFDPWLVGDYGIICRDISINYSCFALSHCSMEIIVLGKQPRSYSPADGVGNPVGHLDNIRRRTHITVLELSEIVLPIVLNRA